MEVIDSAAVRELRTALSVDHLVRSGKADLARNAVAVVSCAAARTDPELLESIVKDLRPLVRDVVVIPFDPDIRSGGALEYGSLAHPTRQALLLACASLIDSLTLTD